jgi:hypothetical protein
LSQFFGQLVISAKDAPFDINPIKNLRGIELFEPLARKKSAISPRVNPNKSVMISQVSLYHETDNLGFYEIKTFSILSPSVAK